MGELVTFSFAKQPSERFAIGVDWSARLGEGETLASVTVEARDLRTGLPADVIESPGISGSISSVVVKNGTDGGRYRITLRVTTSSGSVHEADGTMSVREV